jgi:hypothetical protein
VKAISADGQVIEDTIDINLANSGRYVDWAIHPGTNPSNFRPLSGAITYFPPPPKTRLGLPDLLAGVVGLVSAGRTLRTATAR